MPINIQVIWDNHQKRLLDAEREKDDSIKKLIHVKDEAARAKLIMYVEDVYRCRSEASELLQQYELAMARLENNIDHESIKPMARGSVLRDVSTTTHDPVYMVIA